MDRPPSHCRGAQRPSHKGRGFYQVMRACKLAPPIILLFADFASSRETILPFALKPNFETFGFLNKAWYAEPHDFPSVGVPTSVGLHFDHGSPTESSGAGAHRRGDIADKLGVKVTSLGPVRAKLIKKGMIYSPAHGDMDFTVPLFNEFMIRAIPLFNPT